MSTAHSGCRAASVHKPHPIWYPQHLEGSCNNMYLFIPPPGLTRWLLFSQHELLLFYFLLLWLININSGELFLDVLFYIFADFSIIRSCLYVHICTFFKFFYFIYIYISGAGMESLSFNFLHYFFFRAHTYISLFIIIIILAQRCNHSVNLASSSACCPIFPSPLIHGRLGNVHCPSVTFL